VIHLRIPLAQAYLWVCPQCQSSWAVLDSPEQDWANRGRTVHLFLRIPCKACGGGMLTGGNWAAGLTEDDFEALLTCLPPADLAREALSYLEELNERIRNTTIAA
jgi:hypothetical protein